MFERLTMSDISTTETAFKYLENATSDFEKAVDLQICGGVQVTFTFARESNPFVMELYPNQLNIPSDLGALKGVSYPDIQRIDYASHQYKFYNPPSVARQKENAAAQEFASMFSGLGGAPKKVPVKKAASGKKPHIRRNKSYEIVKEW